MMLSSWWIMATPSRWASSGEAGCEGDPVQLHGAGVGRGTDRPGSSSAWTCRPRFRPAARAPRPAPPTGWPRAGRARRGRPCRCPASRRAARAAAPARVMAGSAWARPARRRRPRCGGRSARPWCAASAAGRVLLAHQLDGGQHPHARPSRWGTGPPTRPCGRCGCWSRASGEASKPTTRTLPARPAAATASTAPSAISSLAPKMAPQVGVGLQDVLGHREAPGPLGRGGLRGDDAQPGVPGQRRGEALAALVGALVPGGPLQHRHLAAARSSQRATASPAMRPPCEVVRADVGHACWRRRRPPWAGGCPNRPPAPGCRPGWPS